MHVVALLLLITAAVVWPASAANWPHTATSSAQVQRFLTFDSKVSAADIATSAAQYDYVWGAESSHVPLYRASNNPTIVLSKYMPFSRDPGPANLTWWQQHHPSWVLYRCDRKTPAYLFSDPNIPLDVSNADVLQYQLNTWVAQAKAEGYHAMACDNYGLENGQQACGVWEAPGVWKQLYSGDPVDAKFAEAQLHWLCQFSAASPLLTVINYSLGDRRWNDSAVLQIGNCTDAVLSERGFTTYGSALATDDEWGNIVRFMDNLQGHGRGYWSINEWGKPDTSIPRAVREFVVASYLVGAGNTSGVYASTIQGYGALLPHDPEYFAALGQPRGPAMPVDSGRAMIRWFEHGVAVVNPSGTTQATVPLGNLPLKDLYNATLPADVTIDATSGLIAVYDTKL